MTDPNSSDGNGTREDEPLLVLRNLRPAPPVETQPFMVLNPWWILELEGGERIIVGITPYGSWRTSTGIVEWHPMAHLARTASGRWYCLDPAHAGGWELDGELSGRVGRSH